MSNNKIKGRQTSEIISNNMKLAKLLREMAKEVLARPVVPMSVWCEKNIVVPSESSSQSGTFKSSSFPFWVPVMDYVLTPGGSCKELIIRKSAQIGYTTFILMTTLYLSVEAPTPMCLVQATKDAAATFSTTKLQPFITENPCVAKTLGAESVRGYQNTTLNKTFPGGFLLMGGANNEHFSKSKSVRVMLIDEEASYDTKTSDGSTIQVFKKRQINYPDRLCVRGTTPKFTETCTLSKDWPSGTQASLYLPCPHCNPNAERAGNWLTFIHDSFKITGEIIDDMPEEVTAICPHCKEEIHESTKSWWFPKLRWMSEKGSPGDPYDMDWSSEIISLAVNAYYSPLGFYSWREAMSGFCKYMRTRDMADLQVYYNQVLGLPIDLTGELEVNPADLMTRAKESNYGKGEVQVPMKALMLCCGVDIQGDRVEAQVVGFGEQGERWVIDYRVFWGDTSTLGDHNGLDDGGRPTAWRTLAEYLLSRKFRHESGCELPIEFTLIDAGFRTDVVHTFCLGYEKRKIFPVIGRPGWDHGKFEAPKRRHKDYGTLLFIARKDPLTFNFREKLAVIKEGPRYIHFANNPRLGKAYFNGLTIEQKVVKKSRGQNTITYENPPGGRNEPADTYQYAEVAFMASGEHLSIRAQRKYPLGEGRLKLWKEDESLAADVRRRAKELESPTVYIPARQVRKTRGMSGARRISKGVV